LELDGSNFQHIPLITINQCIGVGYLNSILTILLVILKLQTLSIIKMKIQGAILMAIVFALSCSLFSCSSAKKNQSQTRANEEMQGNVAIPGPPLVVYKTKKDYFDKVPVTLSDDKTRVVSYPAPSDIKRNGQYILPTRLKDGYLLDNRGISKNSAFLRFSYDDYYTMDNIPTAERLMNYVVDDAPFAEMYDCGTKSDFDNPVEQLNRKIENGEISEYQDLLK